jgi:YgiT-type zinc finger domain-containing protein
MKGDEAGKQWQGMSEEIIAGMTEWRKQRPNARFSEIEAELDRQMSELRAKMLGDLAMQSSQSEWESGEDGPKCPKCGAQLVGKGKKKRKLQTTGGREVEIEREYGVCPACGAGIFPPG